MSKGFFSLEKGIHILGENADTGVRVLFGADAPGGNTDTNESEQGSSYLRTNGELWIKYLAGTGADKWIKTATLNDITSLKWRGDKVRAATGDVAPASGGTIDLSSAPFSDDDAPTLLGADFVVGEFMLFGVGGTPKLMEVTNIAGNVVTFTDPAVALADNTTFVVESYLPDSPDDQEAQAIVHYDGTNIIKLADFNWSLADGISLTSGWVAAAGIVAAGDTLEEAIEKLVGNQGNISSALGIDETSENDMGTYTGDIITDNSSQVTINQELETAIEGVVTRKKADAVTTQTVIDQVLCDEILAIEEYYVITLDSDPTKRVAAKLHAMHDGHVGADAISVDKSGQFGKLRIGNVSVAIDVILSGAGAAQYMQFVITAPAAVSIRAIRRSVIADGI